MLSRWSSLSPLWWWKWKSWQASRLDGVGVQERDTEVEKQALDSWGKFEDRSSTLARLDLRPELFPMEHSSLSVSIRV